MASGKLVKRLLTFALVSGFITLVILFSIAVFFDAAPPDDSDLLPPPRPSVPAELNGFTVVNLTKTDLDELQGIAPAAEDSGPFELHAEQPKPFTEEWQAERAARILPPRALEVRMGVAHDQGRDQEALDDALRIIRLGSSFALSRGEGPARLMGEDIKLKGFLYLHSLVLHSRLSPMALESALTEAARCQTPASARRVAYQDSYVATIAFCEHLVEEGIKARSHLLGKEGCYKPNRTRKIIADHVREVLHALEDASSARVPAGGNAAGAARYARGFGNTVGFAAATSTLEYIDAFLIRSRTERLIERIPRTVFAIRRFKTDQGRWPDALEELVPKYLESVPVDPFEGKPLRYAREKAILYSVGPDGLDGGGVRLPEGLDSAGLTNDPSFRF